MPFQIKPYDFDSTSGRIFCPFLFGQAIVFGAMQIFHLHIANKSEIWKYIASDLH